jgi:hypothetical protein
MAIEFRLLQNRLETAEHGAPAAAVNSGADAGGARRELELRQAQQQLAATATEVKQVRQS